MTTLHEEARAWFTTQLNNETLINHLKTIRLIIADVDGTLTDGNIYVPEGEEEIKGFHVQDGFLIKHAQSHSIHTAFITGRKSTAIMQRAHELGIPSNLCIMGKNDKNDSVSYIQQSLNIDPQDSIFFGDDISDYLAKQTVGLFIAPANAPFYIQDAADLVVPLRGGEGAFRLLMDLILYIQEAHPAQSLIDEVLKRV